MATTNESIAARAGDAMIRMELGIAELRENVGELRQMIRALAVGIDVQAGALVLGEKADGSTTIEDGPGGPSVYMGMQAMVHALSEDDDDLEMDDDFEPGEFAHLCRPGAMSSER